MIIYLFLWEAAEALQQHVMHEQRIITQEIVMAAITPAGILELPE